VTYPASRTASAFGDFGAAPFVSMSIQNAEITIAGVAVRGLSTRILRRNMDGSAQELDANALFGQEHETVSLELG